MDGYMIDAQYDGQVLRVHGKNKFARVALNGEDHAADVQVARQDISEVTYKPASMLTNGAVTVYTRAGKKHILHFRRKQAGPFEQLARALGARGI